MARHGRRASLAALALAGLAAVTPGCGTIIARELEGSHHKAYMGVVLDGCACATLVLLPIGLVDLPLSLVADTICAVVDSTSGTSGGASSPSPSGSSEHRECPKAAAQPTQ